MSNRVVVIGGGLAGLAAASALAPRGFQVTILEARSRLGGRASSFLDPTTGQLIDNCQHVSMGCCTSFAHFCRTVGIDHLLECQRTLRFMTPDGRISRWQADDWPAPFHLLRSFVSAHYLTIGEKLRVATALRGLVSNRNPVSPRNRVSRGDADPPFHDWLMQHRQTPRLVERFWGVVLTSALNESPDRIGLRYARKVFMEAFLSHRDGGTIQLPRVALGRLYGEELQQWFQNHGVRIELNQAVRNLCISDGGVRSVQLRTGGIVEADWFISAVPFDRLLTLLPADVVDQSECFSNLRHLQPSPITSVHVWYDRPVMRWPHIVLVGCVGQWVFNRGESAPGEHGVQVVVSASRQFDTRSHAQVQQVICAEMAELFPQCRKARLVRARVVTERNATFSAVPGVDRWRPKQACPIDNLFLAGDWTDTGWPATMESAVRSGYLAAEALLQRLGRRERILQPDLV